MTPPSPSELLATLTLKDGRIASLMVGGRAQVSATRTIELAD